MDQERKKKHRRAVVFLAVVAGVPALLAVLYMLTLGRPALVGVDSHDFGVVLISEPPLGPGLAPADTRGAFGPPQKPTASVEHTFSLTNRTRRAISIRQIRTSCSCMQALSQTEVVEPGEALDVSVLLLVDENGLSNQTVSIVMEGRGVRTLSVRGIGRIEQQLRTNREHLTLLGERTYTLSVFADVWPDDLPEGQTPELSVDGGDHIRTSLVQWSQQRAADSRRKTPAIWSGRIEIAAKPSGDEPRADTHLTISMEPGQTLSLPVTFSRDEPTPNRAPAGEASEDANGFNPLQFAPGTPEELNQGDR